MLTLLGRFTYSVKMMEEMPAVNRKKSFLRALAREKFEWDLNLYLQVRSIVNSLGEIAALEELEGEV